MRLTPLPPLMWIMDITSFLGTIMVITMGITDITATMFTMGTTNNMGIMVDGSQQCILNQRL